MTLSEPEAELSALVVGRVSYFDSIEIQQNPYYRRHLLLHMKKHCGSMVGPIEIETFKGRIVNSLWLHQPRRKAVEYLLDKGCTITRVDVALDLITEVRAGAERLGDYIRLRMVPNIVAYEPITNYEEASYFHFSRLRGAGKNFLTYSDKPSRTHPGGLLGCCHLEYRMAGAGVLRRNHLRTVEQLLNFDHRRFWEQNLKLREPPTAEELGQEMLNKYLKRRQTPRKGRVATRKVPFGGRSHAVLRLGGLARRLAESESGDLASNDLLHLLRGHGMLESGKFAASFRPIPTGWLLPPPHNGLWRKAAIAGGDPARKSID